MTNPLKSLKLIFVSLFILTANALHASNPVKINQFINHKDWSFVENKGQVQVSDIKYYGHQGGIYLYCKPGMLSFVFTKEEKAQEQISEATGTSEDGWMESPFPKGAAVPTSSGGGFDRSPLSALHSSISTFRTDLVLLNSKRNAKIIATDRQEYYENYYTAPNKLEQAGQAGNADHGIMNVHTYKTITYESVYPHIDMVLQAKEQGMEYSFIIHPGGKVSDIQLQWNGAEKN